MLSAVLFHVLIQLHCLENKRKYQLHVSVFAISLWLSVAGNSSFQTREKCGLPKNAVTCGRDFLPRKDGNENWSPISSNSLVTPRVSLDRKIVVLFLNKMLNPEFLSYVLEEARATWALSLFLFSPKKWTLFYCLTFFSRTAQFCLLLILHAQPLYARSCQLSKKKMHTLLSCLLKIRIHQKGGQALGPPTIWSL